MTYDPRDPRRRYEPPREFTRQRPAPGRGAPRTRQRQAPAGYRPVQRTVQRRVYRLGSQPRRLQALSALVALVVVLLAGRLFYLQGVDGRRLALAAETQRLRTTVLQADRGNIMDRNGNVLATDVETSAVAADPSIITDPAMTATRLAPLLHMDPARIVALLATPGRYVVIAKGLANGIGADIQSLALTGIVVTRDTKRVYPDGDLAAGVIGFTGSDSTGLGGIEYALNSTLMGHDGKSIVETDNAGRQIPGGEKKASPAVAGRNVQLTIDRDIQWMAQSALAAQVKKTKAERGTAIVMDTRTGEILALATVPTFNPNDIAHAKSALLGNPAATDVYEPGSVNKVITAAAALETGVVQPLTPIAVPGTLKVADRIFHDAEQHGTERLTFAGVLAKSSNIGTILTARKLGPNVLFNYLTKFGFGSTTGAGFPAESPGIIRDPKTWSESDQASIPIGQGIAVTPLQVASVYATVANGGVRAAPHIVKATYDTNGKLHPAPEAKQTRSIRSDTAATLRAVLESVTTVDGTAPDAAIDGYRIAGKTGTARKINANGSDYSGYVSSFVGFAPADDPHLVVEVILDNPKTAIFGGVVCAPIFHQIMSFALQTLRIPPTGRPSATFRLTAP